MQLNGSCRCGTVRFAVRSLTPYPYMRCYCSICRKTAGGGGYATNIMAERPSLEVDGRERVTVWQAPLGGADGDGDGGLSPARRHFCAICGSALWIADPRWPQWVYPFAGAVDTPLPAPPERVHIMLDYAAPWVEVPSGPAEVRFRRYPEESILDWHRRHGLFLGG